MTTALWAIVAMGVGVYALRLSGLVPRDVSLPPAWERALGFVPVAVLTALVTSALIGPSGGGATGVVAATGAALVARATGRIWACILSGMVLYGLLRLA